MTLPFLPASRTHAREGADTGERVTPKPAKTSHKAIAAASVRMALESIGKASRPGTLIPQSSVLRPKQRAVAPAKQRYYGLPPLKMNPVSLAAFMPTA